MAIFYHVVARLLCICSSRDSIKTVRERIKVRHGVIARRDSAFSSSTRYQPATSVWYNMNYCHLSLTITTSTPVSGGIDSTESATMSSIVLGQV